MKSVLIIQEAGRNKENAHLREALAIKYAFEGNGWNAEIWGLGYPNFSSVPDYRSCDLIFCIENYSLEWLPDFSKINGPLKAHWIIDLHCASSDYTSLSRGCDVVLHSTRSLIEDYRKKTPNANHLWFPNAVDDRYFYNKKLEKEYNVCFVATPHYRRKEISQYVGAEFFTILGDDMIERVSKSKIQFNLSLSCDVNYRCWETIALGTGLVTNFLPEMLDLGFRSGENCYMYQTLPQAKEQVAILLNDKECLDRIILGGIKLAKSNTYTKRVADLIKTLGYT